MRFRRRRGAAPPPEAPANPEPETYWGHGGPYHAWVDFLRRWAAEEDVRADVLPALADDRFAGETWERLARHLTTALDLRLRAWGGRLTRALHTAADEFSYGRELAQARVGLRAIRAVAGHPGLPDGLRHGAAELVDRHIVALQEQLERGVDEAERSGGIDARHAERRRRTLRDNPLTAATGPKAGAGPEAGPGPAPDQRPRAPADPWGARDPTGPPPRRRVVTD
ncbi:hypothetical protein RB200_42230 [Streptomyces sp. PmtG]